MRFNADGKLKSLYYILMKFQRTRLLILLLAFVSVADSTNGNGSGPSNVTYAPPPPINQTVIATFNNSPIGQKLIVSHRFENFQITQNNNNASQLVSNFRINFFNRAAPNNIKGYNISNVMGNWSFLASTTDTLSCSLVYEANNGIYGFIQFDPKKDKFEFVYNGTNTSLPVPVQNFTFTAMPQKITLGTGCRSGIFNGQAFSLNFTSRSWSQIVVPTNWTLQGGSESMNYTVSQGKLYKYNMSSNTYGLLQSLKNYPTYQVHENEGRVIVIGFNSSAIDNRTSQVNQSIFIFDDQPSKLTVFTAIDITGQSQQNFIPIVVSPQATKIGYMGLANDSSPAFLIKQIDYINNKISNIVPADPQHLLTTLKGSSLQEIELGDFYLVARNVTGPPPPANSNGTNGTNGTNQNVTPYEEAYQFVGNKLMFFRGRNLTGNEITNWQRLAIDPFFTNSLMVLNAYNITGGLELHQFDYGSLAASNKIVPPVAPPFLTFPIPANTHRYSPEDSFSWTFINNLAGPSSNFSLFTISRNSTNKLNLINFTLSGNWSILAQNQECLLISDFSASNYTLLKFDQSNNTFKFFADLSPIAATANATLGSKWVISDRADRIAIDQRIYSNQPNNVTNYRPISNNLTTFLWTSVDRNITTAISNNSLWNFNTSLGGFTKFFDSPVPYLPLNRILTLQNKIIVSSLNNTAAQIVAYSNVPGTNLSECFRFAFNNYLNKPDIQVSTNLTKILIMGPFTPPNTTEVKPKIDAFFVDYDRKVATNVTFPYEAVRNPRTTYVRIEEEFLYIRQLPDNSTNSTDARQEFVFFLDKNIVSKLVAKVNITTPANVEWKKSLIQKTPEGKIYVQAQTSQGNATLMNVVIVETEVSANQASLNSNGNGNQMITGVIIDGKVKLCSTGCSDCSSGTCSDCFPRYVFDANTATCLSCGLNCLYCSSSNTQSCSACLKGSYLSGTSCMPCDPTCVTCNGTATTCDICPPGKYFSGSNCSACPKNCFNCSSSTVCITCRHGFALDPTGKCRGCSISCSSCNPANITECTSCAHGLQLVKSACVACPDKCVSCTNGICALCIPGYQVSTSGVCVLGCQLPCATCADNQPAVCTSCYNGVPTSGKCVLDVSCNANSTCTDCGTGLNYVLLAGQCLSCAEITNCIQCSPVNTLVCDICAQGYFKDGTTGCTACPSTCTSCVSATLYVSCAIGYSLAQDQTQGACLQCVSPCATCIGSPTYCTSCVSGFTKQGWKCQNNTYVGFTIVLNTLATNVLGNIDAIVAQIVSLDTTNMTDTSSITFISIQDGSAIVSGTVTGATTTILSAGLSSGASLAGYSIQSSTIVSYGSSTTDDTSASKNLPLIIGLSVGLPLLIIALIVGVVIYKRRKNVANESQSIPMNVEIPHESAHHPIDGESPEQASQPITIIHASESNTAWLKET